MNSHRVCSLDNNLVSISEEGAAGIIIWLKYLLFESQSINAAHQVALISTPFPFLEALLQDYTHLLLPFSVSSWEV